MLECDADYDGADDFHDKMLKKQIVILVKMSWYFYRDDDFDECSTADPVCGWLWGEDGHPGNHTDIRSQIESGPGKYENNLLKIWDIDILSSDDVLS